MLPFERNEDVVAVKVVKGNCIGCTHGGIHGLLWLSLLTVLLLHVDDAMKDNLLCTANILTQFSHHNILNLLAVTASPSMVVVPYLELADLKKYLVR